MPSTRAISSQLGALALLVATGCDTDATSPPPVAETGLPGDSSTDPAAAGAGIGTATPPNAAAPSCCSGRLDPGCSDVAVEACVCALDAYCCEERWDELCASEVDDFNCGACSDSVSCCTADDGPGCSVGRIEQCVCDDDPYCCNTAWDATCVGKITSLGCGTCEPLDLTIAAEQESRRGLGKRFRGDLGLDGDLVTIDYGADGPAAGSPTALQYDDMDWSLSGPSGLKSQGEDVTYTWDAGTQTLQATAGGRDVFTVELDGNGDYTFTLQDSIDHDPAAGENSKSLSFDLTGTPSDGTATDYDLDPSTLAGVSISQTFSVNVTDDVPEAAEVATPQVADTVTLDEDDLSDGTDDTKESLSATGDLGLDGDLVTIDYGVHRCINCSAGLRWTWCTVSRCVVPTSG